MGQKHILFSLLFIILLTLISYFAFAEYPKEKPISAIGCEFLSIFNDSLFVVGLYNNTMMYVDTNNDNAWEISYALNEGDNMTVKQLNQNLLPVGSKIYSTKPVWLRQRNAYYYNYNSYTGFVKKYERQMTLSPISNLNTRYISQYSKIYLVTDKDASVKINDDVYLVPSKTLFSKNISVPAKITSDVPVYAFSDAGPLNALSNDFYSDFDAISIYVPDDETTLYFDYDLDGNYDNMYIENKGVFSYTFSNYGVHVWSDKDIGMSSMMNKIKDPYGIYTYYTVYPASQMSNEYFVLSPQNSELASFTFVHDFFDNSTTKIYSFGDFQKGTNTEISSNKILHVYADRPFLTKSYYYNYNVAYGVVSSFESTAYPSPDLVFIQYPNQKNILSNSNVTMTARLFNTFITMAPQNISITFVMSDIFTFFDAKTKVYLKNIFDDSIIEEITNLPVISKKGELVFSFDTIPANSYLEIQYSLLTPNAYTTYKTNDVFVSYDVNTWS